MNAWSKKLGKLARAERKVLETAKRLKRFEKTLKQLSQRQRALIKLIEELM
jgi:hypothetical protein